MPTIMSSTTHIEGASFYKLHTYKSGSIVPIYNVETIEAMTQVIGYVKYINSDYGTVLYRGECKIHNTVLPSIYSYGGNYSISHTKDLNICLDRALNDSDFAKFAGLSKRSISRHIVESIFQHYGIPTYHIDLVDNHWSALWFGLHSASVFNGKELFVEYTKRGMDVFKTHQPNYNHLDDESLYQYLVCIAIDNKTQSKGISKSNDTIAIDLRSALPSTFLRPHAQHGWTAKKCTNKCEHDLSSNVVAIVRIRIDMSDRWLGNGELMSVRHMFPRPASDYGYDVMLERHDLFEGTPFRVHYYV